MSLLQVLRFSSDQIVRLVEVLLNVIKGDKPPCVIIFVQRRFTAKIVFFILQTLKENVPAFSKINSNYVVGLNSDPYSQTRENMYTSKMNRMVVKDFCERKIHIMVASNVLEEGIDVPTCTLVVRFDKPLDYRSYIQSKGRARHKESEFKVFVSDQDFQRFSDRYNLFQKVEKKLIGVSKRFIKLLLESVIQLWHKSSDFSKKKETIKHIKTFFFLLDFLRLNQVF